MNRTDPNKHGGGFWLGQGKNRVKIIAFPVLNRMHPPIIDGWRNWQSMLIRLGWNIQPLQLSSQRAKRRAWLAA
jgi:hypothetical protein